MLFYLAGCLPGMAQVGFQVSPARIFFHKRSEPSQTAIVHINNPTDTRLVLQATCVDWRRDSTGSKNYTPPGSLPTSCSSSIRISPSVVELAPGEKRDIVITFTAASGLPMDRISNAMLLFTQSNEQELAKKQFIAPQLIIRVQIGVHVYFLPKDNLTPAIDITTMEVTKKDEQHQVRVKIHNTGQALLESQLRLEYLNLQTMEEVKAEPVPVNTMPHDRFWVTAQPPQALKTGNYLIVAVLDSGSGMPLKVAELETVLK
jgi:hypothetical protein